MVMVTGNSNRGNAASVLLVMAVIKNAMKWPSLEWLRWYEKQRGSWVNNAAPYDLNL